MDKGDDPARLHVQMAAALDAVIHSIRDIQTVQKNCSTRKVAFDRTLPRLRRQDPDAWAPPIRTPMAAI